MISCVSFGAIAFTCKLLQAKQMALTSTGRIPLQLRIFPMMTFIVTISTTSATTTTTINATWAEIPREAVGISLLPLAQTTEISFTKANSEQNVSVLATASLSNPGEHTSLTTEQPSTVGKTRWLHMYNYYKSSVSPILRNTNGQNYSQNDRVVFLNEEYGLLPNLFHALLQGGKTPDNYPISYKCGNNLAMYYLALSSNESWAWSGKPRPGLLSGTMTWSGNLQQCLNTHGKLSQDESPAEVRTQYCSVFISPPTWLIARMRSFSIPFPVASPSFITDVCTLSACSGKELLGLFQKYVAENSWRENLTVTNVRCYKEKKLWHDSSAVLSLCIIFLLLLLVLAGTVYEIILRASRRGVKSSLDIHIGLHLGNNSMPTESDDLNTPKLTSFIYQNNDRISDTQTGNRDNNPEQARPPDTNLACSNTDIGMLRPDMQASLKSSTDVRVSIIQLQHQDGESFSQTNEADGTKGVKHPNLEISAQQSTNAMSTNINIVHGSDELSGANNTNNQLPAVLVSTDSNQTHSNGVFKSPIKSIIYHSSTYRNKSLPRMKKRHLQTQLSATVTEKTSLNTVILLQKILVTFSIRRNLTNIFGKGNADMLFCVNGIRVLGNSWIVLGSYFMTIYANPSVVENHLTISKIGQSFWGQSLVNTSLAADTFFVLSGALKMYELMKATAKSGCKKSMFHVISPAGYVWSVIHRLFRIIPCYYIALMIHVNLSGYLGTGHELRQQTDSSGQCSDHWWANILFISNFYKADQMCMPWSYYLVSDLQLSILSPLLTIPLLCRPVLGCALIGCLVGLQIVSVMVINTRINGNSMRMNTPIHFSEVHVKPYCRMGVYAIGVGLGYLLHSGDKKIRLRKAPLCLGWLLCLTAVLLLPHITYLQYDEGGSLWSGFETSLYEALSPPVWGMAVSWIIFTCCNGQGGLIAKFLSWNIFIPVARITYAIYVLHPVLMSAVLVSAENSTKVNFGQMTLGYISLLVGSWCLAVILNLLVEQPFVNMEAVISKHIHNKRTT